MRIGGRGGTGHVVGLFSLSLEYWDYATVSNRVIPVRAGKLQKKRYVSPDCTVEILGCEQRFRKVLTQNTSLVYIQTY